MTTATMRCLVVTLAVTLLTLSSSHAAEYGVDCSFPQHGLEFRCNDEILDDRKGFYKDFMDGCAQAFNRADCEEEELGRIEENFRKPKSMVNFTKTGFMKSRCPDEIMNLLTTHWKRYIHDIIEEDFGEADTTTNHWAAGLYLVDVNWDADLPEKVYNAAKAAIEEWTGMEQRPVSLYGIRAYHRGSVLTPHVDRYPLVSSVIINVDQDVDEEWPLEVIGRDGKAVNITMEPGDWVFYESHSIIHGRPFALKGSFLANVFCHFEPTGRRIDAEGNYYWKEGEELTNGLPPYIIPGSPEETEWRNEYPDGWYYEDPFEPDDEEEEEEDRPAGHDAAGNGDTEKLKFFAKQHPDWLHESDGNGWKPIHEAARSGQLDAVSFLLENGANVNVLTDNRETPYDLVLNHMSKSHPLVQFLADRGGVSGDEL